MLFIVPELDSLKDANHKKREAGISLYILSKYTDYCILLFIYMKSPLKYCFNSITIQTLLTGYNLFNKKCNNCIGYNVIPNKILRLCEPDDLTDQLIMSRKVHRNRCFVRRQWRGCELSHGLHDHFPSSPSRQTTFLISRN